MQVKIPANTEADIYVPLKNIKGEKEINVDGNKIIIKEGKYTDWHILENVGSGDHTILVNRL